MPQTELERIRELLAAAAPRPWSEISGRTIGSIPVGRTVAFGVEHQDAQAIVELMNHADRLLELRVVAKAVAECKWFTSCGETKKSRVEKRAAMDRLRAAVRALEE